MTPAMVFALLETQWVAFGFAAAIVLIIATAAFMKWLERGRRLSVEKELAAQKAAAEAEAQKIIAQAQAAAQSEFIERRKQFDGEADSIRRELRAEERRIAKREDMIDEKLQNSDTKDRQLAAAAKAASERERALAEKDRQLDELTVQKKAELLKVAGLSQESARKEVLEQVETEVKNETDQLIERRLEEAKASSEEQAREVIVTAIQRYAADQAFEVTVSTVEIPSDDMKGRVIGREGRNIRAFEKATGVDVIVDDTPGVVVVSAFDPVRRQVAKRALEKLIQDGRIHPTRIEEVVASVEKDINREIFEHGKEAMAETNVRGLRNKLITLLGRLHFRTSYGQNVLRHSVEVAYLGQIICDELGLDGQLARRCGLLHDIGKAIDHEVEGGHPQIGADLCKRYGEKEEVINAVAGHHGDVEATSIYTPIISAADAISASRPGARRESLQRYIQRIEKLEDIAQSFEGVNLSYAIQAGREVRVMVDAANVDDRLSAKIARDIARRIEDEMEYPGEVKVTLIRETRYTEYAK
ncbi:MAG: ribonuclease Y [Planctomycetes bacterium]|nr:ribonuclease Y [Planctomycetota bacterium]